MNTFYQKIPFTPTEEQIRIIEAPLENMLVIATAGAGKTTTMALRLAYLQAHYPQKNLALSFSRKSIGDFKAKYQAFFGPSQATFATVHALCYRIAKKFYTFTLLDSPECSLEKYTLLSRAYWDLSGQYPTKELLEEYFTAFSYLKNTFHSPKDHPGDLSYLKELFASYQATLDRHQVFDFEDLISYALAGLEDHPAYLRRLQESYGSILVDEAQDISPLQATFIDALAGSTPLCLIGDDDQAIYSFRGGSPAYLLEKKDFSTYQLSKNHRCGSTILQGAKNLIHHNKVRYFKEIQGGDHEGRLTLRTYEDQNPFTGFFLDHSPKEHSAILAKTNYELAPLIHGLQKLQLPYVAPQAAASFKNFWLIKDLLTFLHLMEGPIAAHQLMSIFPRIGLYLQEDQKKTLQHNNLPISKERALLGALTTRQKKDYQNFEKFLDRCKDEVLTEQIESIWTFSPYQDYLQQRIEKGHLSRAYLTLLKDGLLFMAQDFTKASALTDYLENLPLDRGGKGKRSLLTLHASKGLEFKEVYLFNLSKDILPASGQDLEEERRLCYVGLTRGIDHTIITYQKPSPFIDQIRGGHQGQQDFLRAQRPLTSETPLELGMILYHEKFGQGEITYQDQHTLRILFSSGTDRKFSKSYLIEKGLVRWNPSSQKDV